MKVLSGGRKSLFLIMNSLWVLKLFVKASGQLVARLHKWSSCCWTDWLAGNGKLKGFLHILQTQSWSLGNSSVYSFSLGYRSQARWTLAQAETSNGDSSRVFWEGLNGIYSCYIGTICNILYCEVKYFVT